MEKQIKQQIENTKKQIAKKLPSPSFCYFLFAIFIFLCRPSLAESGPDLFKAGNTFYAEGKFSEAAKQYEAAAASGLKHWALEYNLGNASWRSGEIGKAILHYERAFRMNPGQGDVIYNLNLSTNKAGDPELPAGALPVLAWRLFYILSINALTLWVSAFFIFFCAAAGLAFADRSALKRETWVGLGSLFIVLAGWLVARIYILEHPQGVVITSIAEVRSGPSTTYPTNFTVPEGHRVLILDEQEPVQGWLEVGAPEQGLKGWAPENSIEII